MSHYCSDCRGHTSGNSPCAPEEPELPERECQDCGHEADWEDANCQAPDCDATLRPTLVEYLEAQQEGDADAMADYLYDLSRED